MIAECLNFAPNQYDSTAPTSCKLSNFKRTIEHTCCKLITIFALNYSTSFVVPYLKEGLFGKVYVCALWLGKGNMCCVTCVWQK